MRRLPSLKSALRKLFGQERQLTLVDRWIIVELRGYAAGDESFTQELEHQLLNKNFVQIAKHVPELDRFIVKVKRQTEGHKREVISLVERLETKFGYQHALFSTRTRFPEETLTRYRTLIEMGIDVLSFSGGLVLGQLNRRSFNFFTDLSALSVLVENIPELRGPLDNVLGHENSELLIRVVSSVSDSFSHGWSGSLVDLIHRSHEWKAEKAREQSWLAFREQFLERIERGMISKQIRANRPCPLPDGPVEKYLDTAEKFSLASFSAGIAFTHSLNSSARMLFTAIPKPAIRGRDSFCLELLERLTLQNMLVLDPGKLACLDRVDCLALDSGLLQPSKLAATSVYIQGKTQLDSQQVEELLQKGCLKLKRSTLVLSPAADETKLNARVEKWWQETDQPLSSLYLVKRGQTIVAAIIAQNIVDETIESIQAKARVLKLKVDLFDPDKDDQDKIKARLQQRQLQGSVIMGIGRCELIRYCDIAVGQMHKQTAWPSTADIVVSDPVRSLWLLLDAVNAAKAISQQSVELAKIDAFSGLILSLDMLDPRTLGRIRLAANVATLASMLNAYRAALKLQDMPSNLLFDTTPWHAMDTSVVLERLGKRLEQALANRDSLSELPSQSSSPSLKELWIEEMSSPLVPVLLTGAGLAAFTGAIVDALLISAVIAGNGLIGGIQRQNTEAKLSEMGMTTEQVFEITRLNESQMVSSVDLLPGDIIELAAGEVVPADARILESVSLEMDESSLTGESLPVKKSSKPSYSMTIADRKSMIYEGTAVCQGTVKAVIVAEQIRSESRRAQGIKAPLFNGVESRLNQLTELTVPMAAFSGIAVMLSGLSRKQPVQDVIGAGVSLAVAAVPEGLPILATLAQLSAANRLSDKGAYARNPRAIEALGRMSVLCADKTGTLTEGSLALKLIAIDGELLAVDQLDEKGQRALETAMLASPEDVGTGLGKHMTDEAVGKAARLHYPDLCASLSRWKRVKDLPFKSERGYHASLFTCEEEKRLCAKGAPDILLDKCNRWMQPDGQIVEIDEANRQRLHDLAISLATRGYRVLAITDRPARSLTLNRDKVTNMVFRGYLAMSDPVRESAKNSVKEFHDAGIAVKMITGDHPVTAQAIAKELQINGHAKVLTGSEMNALSDAELAEKVKDVAVFARVTPAQKAKIVTALQANGEVVGMTGDGANDAAAIRLAEVGIALGEESSYAAQKAADLFVVDSRIETIVRAVMEGRALWTAVRDAVSLLVGGNLGEIGFTLIAGLLDGKSPLNARQLLLINLLTDTVPALAVAMRKPDKIKAAQLLAEGPEQSLGESLNREIQWRAGLTGGITTVSWALDRWFRGPEHASTVGMLTLIGSQLVQTIVAGKGSKEVIISSVAALAALVAIVETPGVSTLFGCTRPGIIGWMNVLATTSLSVVGAETLPSLEEMGNQTEEKIRDTVLEWLSETEAQNEPSSN